MDQALRAFIDAEIRNEDHGGVSPATVASAADSATQMPADILADYTPDPVACLQGLLNLFLTVGGDARLADL